MFHEIYLFIGSAFLILNPSLNYLIQQELQGSWLYSIFAASASSYFLISYRNFYEAEIARISYGGKKISLAQSVVAAGRVIFDSGSSYTYFPKQAYADLILSVCIVFIQVKFGSSLFTHLNMQIQSFSQLIILKFSQLEFTI